MGQAGQWLTELLTLGLAPAPRATLAPCQVAAAQAHYCRQWLVWGQLYVGLVLGSYLVWLLEQQGRHIFLLQASGGLCFCVFL